jgi:hypothetical protein
MVTTTSEQAGGFNPKVTDCLFATVHHAMFVWCFKFIFLLLGFLLLCRSHGFALSLFGFEMFENRIEITFFKRIYFGAVAL